jgi:hypothetical protein
MQEYYAFVVPAGLAVFDEFAFRLNHWTDPEMFQKMLQTVEQLADQI